MKKEVLVALAGNPNVGKSTIFNALTHERQHTGNWAGKTVASASGRCVCGGRAFLITDTPGAYSLKGPSRDEKNAADFILHGGADATVVVCDATCLERGLILALEIMSAAKNVVLCVNLMDEAKKKGVSPDLELLSRRLGVPVAACSARRGEGIDALMAAVERAAAGGVNNQLRLTLPPGASEDEEAALYVRTAEAIARECVKTEADSSFDRRLDRVFLSRAAGFPIMALLLFFVFWLTVSGANYPSEALSFIFGRLGERLSSWAQGSSLPPMLSGALIDGVYRVLTWVIAVMLPPMAIFFPMFALLEDFGYLPRIAFNLDALFRRACACGKQSLTMCMGFGCNAVGVTGCRIIDSPRERLIAMITNAFVPCNGRFPALIAIITMFFAGGGGALSKMTAALILFSVILLGVILTLLVSKLLSETCLRGIPSSFVLELPPYRVPRIGQVIFDSVRDRIVFVLGRAASVAAPAGFVIWVLANVFVGDKSLIMHITDFLDPFARQFGLDGVILTAFILGFPANEIVLPLILMGYMATGAIAEPGSLAAVREVFTENGWGLRTAVCTLLFTLVHWPCSTTVLTIKKESGSLLWTAVSVLVPAACGLILCFAAAHLMSALGIT